MALSVYLTSAQMTKKVDVCMPDEHACTQRVAFSPGPGPSCDHCCSFTDNGFERCGGLHSNPWPKNFVFLGCFRDSFDRTLPHWKGDLNGAGYHRDTCRERCIQDGHIYFGLQMYGECWCGDEAVLSEKLSYSDCDTPCNAMQDEFCGGVFANSVPVYRVNGLSKELLTVPVERAAEFCSATPVTFIANLAAYCRDNGGCGSNISNLFNKCGNGIYWTGTYVEVGLLFKWQGITGRVYDWNTGESREYRTMCFGLGANLGGSFGGVVGFMPGGTFDDLMGWAISVDADLALIGGAGGVYFFYYR